MRILGKKKGFDKLDLKHQRKRSSTPTSGQIQLSNRLPLGDQDEFIFELNSSESEKEYKGEDSIDEEMKMEVIEKDQATFFDDKLELNQQTKNKLSLVEEEKEDADESME